MAREELQITQSEIEEAYKVLGISKAKEEPENKEEPDEDEEKEGGSEEVKAEKRAKREKKEKKEKIEKALADNQTASDLLKKELDILENKGDQVQPTEGLGVLLKAQSEEISSLRKVNTELRSELGGVNTKLETITKSLTDVTALVEKIGDQPQGRRSIQPGSFLEKAFQEEEGEAGKTGKKMLSLSGHKKEIRNFLMEESGIQKGKKDGFYSDGLEFFEATGKLTEKVIVALFKDKNIKIVP